MIGQPGVIVASASLERELEAFFAAHYGRLVRLAALICHSASNTEDAVQAAMEQAWRRRSSLRDTDRLRPWLDRIVVREAVRLNRGSWWSGLGAGTGREDVARSVDEGETALASAPDPRSRIDPAWIALVEAYRKLPVEQRAAIALHLYAGYAVEETADLMGASIETTRSRLRLGRGRLRRELNEGDR